MSVLSSRVRAKPICLNGILRTISESSVPVRLSNAQAFYSGSLLLDNVPSKLANRLTHIRDHGPIFVNRTIFEDYSEEYFEDDVAVPPKSSVPVQIPVSQPLLPMNASLDKRIISSGETASSLAESNPKHHLSRPFAHGPRIGNVTGLAPSLPEQHIVNAAVFETVSEDYYEHDVTTLSEVEASSSACPRERQNRGHRIMKRKTGLKALVSSGDIARAESLRQELCGAGVHIKRDAIYSKAALHAWKVASPDERTERFYEWFKLMPSASIGRIRRTRFALHSVRKTLFSEPSDLNTIACFALVAARKGYANYVSVDIVAHIARFASPEVSSAFFDEIEKAATRFYSRFSTVTVENSSFSLWDANRWHNTFIRALCFAGYIDAAVDRLAHVLRSSPSIHIAPFTWAVLLETLNNTGRTDLVQVIRDLRSVGERSGIPVSSDGVRREEINLPSAGHLACLIDQYIKENNLEELDRTQLEMTKSNARPDLWVTAQLKFYLDRQQYIVVLRQFMQYYNCIGIPRALILPYVQEGSDWLRGKADKVHPSLPIISPPASLPSINHWPSTHTLTMVWQSLVNLAEDPPHLQELYSVFLRHWDHHCPSTASEGPPILSGSHFMNIRFKYPPVMQPDNVHFQMFIVAFARMAGAEAAMQVFVDMQARGIRPDAHNWTALAGHYARQEEVGNAEKILERMEASLTKDQAAPTRPSAFSVRPRTRTGPVHRPADWIPEPNLVTYTTILRGLVDRGRVEEAKQFAERMSAAGYQPGTDERTDSVFELLAKREESSRAPWRHQTRR